MQSLLKELFPNFLGRIFQVKGQSKNSNITIFILSFFIFIKNMQNLSKADKSKLSQRIGRKVMGLRYCLILGQYYDRQTTSFFA
jgi:hypothetical protein